MRIMSDFIMFQCCFSGHFCFCRTKSISSILELDSLLDVCPFAPGQEVNGTHESCKLQSADSSPLLARADLSGLNRKNWKYLSNDGTPPEHADPFKTWDCPATGTGIGGGIAGLECPQRSYTAPDKTGIRIYYSPPAVRRMEAQLSKGKEQQQQQQAQRGHSSRGGGRGEGQPSVSAPTSSTSLSSPGAYDQWLSTLSQQHRELLEGRSGVVSGGAASLHGLEIAGNLSDDMKEMTNCVRQAIRSSSLERKSSKDAGSQTVGVTSTGTQTARLVSVGMQTEGSGIGSRPGLHGKSWSPRPTSASSLASARSRQISSSLEKVAGRIERPCCSPKYGSPKLQRRVSASSSRLDAVSTSSAGSSTASRDRSLWSLHQRSSSCGGSAWARSTTTRDSPVLSGLNDGLSSLFSVVEHGGSSEALWGSGTHSPGHQPPAGKPSCPSPGVGLGDSALGAGVSAGSHRPYGAVQDFIRNVCGGRPQGPAGADEPKPECLSGMLVGSDNVTKIVNKRFMKPARDDLGPATISKDVSLRDSLPGSGSASASGALEVSGTTVDAMFTHLHTHSRFQDVYPHTYDH